MELINSKEDTLKRTLEDATPKKAREKGNTQYKKNRAEERAKVKATLEKEMADQDSAKRIRYDLELLDEVIQRGFDNLCKMDVISPVTSLKAIELKHKLFNGGIGGHTIYGLEEIKLHEAARNEAIIAVIKEYIPED